MAPKVLGRTACLGQWVMSARGFSSPFNQPKTRVDMVLRWMRNVSERPRTEYIRQFMARLDILGSIDLQRRLPWMTAGRPDLLVMDSYSELVDQRFTNKKDGWSFCCCYTDLRHTEQFKEEFSEDGLLPVDQIEKAYDEFFAWFRGENQSCPIVFIHFPTKFDEREKFKERGRVILDVLGNMSIKYGISDLRLDDDEVFQKGDGDRYHFDERTVRVLKEKWK